MSERLSPEAPKPALLIVHGFGAHWLVMYPLARRMRSHGYQVTNWTYGSLWKDIPHHADNLCKVVQELDESEQEFHIVAHSMGSILVRVMLKEQRPQHLKRIVMIAPPNRGSHQATRFSPFFGWLSTTLTQIQDMPDSFVNRLQHQIPADYEIGIIQAQTDLVVAQDCTHLPEAKEYLQLPGFHSSVLFKERTAEQVDHFLETGAFAASS